MDALVVSESKGIDAELLHHTVRSRNAVVANGPYEHMRSFRVQELEILEVVMG